MKRRILLSVISFLVLMPLLRAQCPNLDFSNRDFTGWKCYTSYSNYYDSNNVYHCKTYYDSLVWKEESAPISGRHTIISDPYGTDRHTCGGIYNDLPLIPDGYRYCARIGNYNVGGEAESIRYRIVVDSSNYLVAVHFAAVLEFSRHWDESESPRFGIRFQDTTGKPLPVGNLELSVKDTAQLINCYGVYWKDWDVLAVNLSPWIGQTVELVIYAMDCGKSGHYGYGYAVCECGVKGNERYCSNSSVAELSAPFGFSYYCWVDSAGKVLDTVQRIKIINPQIGTEYRCFMSNVQGSKDTISLRIRQTLISPSIMCQRDSLTPFIRLANRSVISGSKLANQTWQINRQGGGTEYISRDSVFDYCFKDTGMYEVMLTVETANGCSDTCSRRFRVAPVPTDVEMVAFLNPAKDTLSDVHSFYPEVRVANHGKHDVYFTDAYVELYDSNMFLIRKLTESVGTIPRDDTLSFRFKDSLRCTDFTGMYFLKAYLNGKYMNDISSSNDTLLKPLYLQYPDTVKLSVTKVDVLCYNDFVDRWLSDYSTMEINTPIRIRANITKYSNYLMGTKDSVRLTAVVSDSLGRMLQSQSVWIASSVSYDNAPYTFPVEMVTPCYAPCYKGQFYVSVFFDACSKDLVHVDDTCTVRRNCLWSDSIDIQILSVRPQADSIYGRSVMSAVVEICNSGNVEAWYTYLEVHVTDSAGNLIKKLTRNTIVNIQSKDTLRFVFSSYQVPDYTGVYRLKAVANVNVDVDKTNNTLEYVAHCFSYKHVLEIISVRPDADSLEGRNETFPILLVCNTGSYGLQNTVIQVHVLDSSSKLVSQLSDTLPTLLPGDTAEFGFKSLYSVPDYTGTYRMMAICDVDTALFDAHCFKRPDTADVELVWVKPYKDTLEGLSWLSAKIKISYYSNNSNSPSSITVYPEVILLDSSGRIVGTNSKFCGVFIRKNETKEETLCPNTYIVGFDVPNYTGYYYLKTYVSWDGSCNMLVSNDTVVYKAYCYKHQFVDVQLVSVRPQKDSVEGRTKNAPVVTVTNVGNLDAHNIALNVVVMSSGWKILASLTDTIPFLAAGDTLVKKFTSFFLTPDYNGIYTMQAYHTTDKDESNGHDSADYRTLCFKHPDTLDIEMVSILSPAEKEVLQGRVSFSPIVRAKLLWGNDTATGLLFKAELYDHKGQLVDTASVRDTRIWESGDNNLINFPSMCPPNYLESYRLKIFYAPQTEDPNLKNDTLETTGRCSYTVDLAATGLLYPSPDSIQRGGSIICPQISISNLVNNDVDSVTVCCHVLDWKGKVVDTVFEFVGKVEGWETNGYLLKRGYVVPNYSGRYFLKVWPYCDHLDLKQSNDTLLVRLNAYRFDTVDISLIEIALSSADTLWGESHVQSVLRLTNRSVLDVNGFGVWIEATDSAGRVLRTWEEGNLSIKAGDTLSVRCSKTIQLPNYTGKVCIRAAVSQYPKNYALLENDTLVQCFQCLHRDTVDVALTTLVYPTVNKVLPGNTEVRPQVRVVNRGNVEADSLVIDALVYDQSGTLTDSLSGMIVLLEEGADTLYTFPTAYLVPNVEGSYTLKLQVHAPYGDACLANNVLQCQLRSRKNNAVDLQLLSVTLSDTGVLVGNAWVYPTVRVANPLRNADANDVKVYVEVQDSAGQRLGILRDELALVPLADTVELVFADTFQVPNYTGNFWVKAYVEVVLHEADRSNDTLLCAYFCQSSDAVPTVAIDSWQLGQNLPNPATGMTQVPVTLPEPGRVLLQIHSAEGRLLYRGEHAVMDGKTLLPLDLAGYAAGVYYYSVEYRGERKVRKMVVE